MQWLLCCIDSIPFNTQTLTPSPLWELPLAAVLKVTSFLETAPSQGGRFKASSHCLINRQLLRHTAHHTGSVEVSIVNVHAASVSESASWGTWLKLKYIPSDPRKLGLERIMEIDGLHISWDWRCVPSWYLGCLEHFAVILKAVNTDCSMSGWAVCWIYSTTWIYDNLCFPCSAYVYMGYDCLFILSHNKENCKIVFLGEKCQLFKLPSLTISTGHLPRSQSSLNVVWR